MTIERIVRDTSTKRFYTKSNQISGCFFISFKSINYIFKTDITTKESF